MAHDLARARLLTVDGFGHTELFNPSKCASNYEFRYLLTGNLPPQGTHRLPTERPAILRTRGRAGHSPGP
jgi:hypothetical protein